MKRSTVSIVFNIFLVVGLIMLTISGIICYNVKKFNATAVKTSGTVIDLIAKRSSSGKSSTYSPVVTYNDASGTKHRYISSFSSNPPGYDIGETVEILYDPKKPDDATIAGWSEYFGAMICGILGLVFSLTGLGYHIVRRANHSRAQRLKQSGELIRADFVSVDVNNAVSVNRRHPFFILCDWKDPLTGQRERFKSGFIWSDPTPFIDLHKKIDVYIDRNNRKKYYVDISFLQEH